MHSFSRVVRRNEREAILREPAAWNPLSSDVDSMRPTGFAPKRNPFSSGPFSVGNPSVMRDVQRKRYTRFEEPVRRASSIHEISDPFADFEMPRNQSWQPRDGRGTYVSSSSRRSSVSQLIPTDIRDSEIDFSRVS